MGMLTAKVTIKGTRPLWQHHFGPDAIPLQKGEKTGVAGNDPEEWRRTCQVTKDGQLYLDRMNVFSAVTNGGRYVPKSRSNIMADIAATLEVLDDCVLVEDRFFPGFPNGTAFNAKSAPTPPTDPELPVYLDIRSVVNPQTRARNVRYRLACSPGWVLSFTIMWDSSVVSRGPLHSALISAGRLGGIGNGRRIGMGRFTVEQYEVTEEAPIDAETQTTS